MLFRGSTSPAAPMAVASPGMPQTTLVASSCAMVVLGASSADAAQQCRDDKGKFIKCPPVAAEPATRCRDIKTKKFAKCGTAGTEPVPAKTP